MVQSRSGTDLTHRFPEVLAAVREQLGDVVVDGELVALRPEGLLDFAALQSLPSARRRAGVHVYFVIFDLLAAGGEDKRRLPHRTRRAQLEHLLRETAPPLQLVPMTTDPQAARTWMDPAHAVVGIEGVVAKPLEAPYRAGRSRSGWSKIRQKVAVDARVIGVTGSLTRPDALVLADPDSTEDTEPRAVGLSVALRPQTRAALEGRLHPAFEARRLPGVVGGLPGHRGVSYLPVAPHVLVEVEADPHVDFSAFRHRPRVVRIKAEP